MHFTSFSFDFFFNFVTMFLKSDSSDKGWVKIIIYFVSDKGWIKTIIYFVINFLNNKNKFSPRKLLI